MLDIWKLVRIWILTSWSFLTIGILLGSWWAYHELGWGGWWFWDPVENASLMPWLLATAGIHSITKRSPASGLFFLTIICTQGTFILSILGTFFVRSGALASVHTFATDSTRGLYLFLFLLLITAISVFNWCEAWLQSFSANGPLAGTPFAIKRATQFRLKRSTDGRFAPPPKVVYNKTGKKKKKRGILLSQLFVAIDASHLAGDSIQILYLQNFYFCVICIVVFFGTSSPIFYQWFWNRDVGTGAPFYNGTLIPLFTSVFLVLVYAHYLQFDRSNKKVRSSTQAGASTEARWNNEHPLRIVLADWAATIGAKRREATKSEPQCGAGCLELRALQATSYEASKRREASMFTVEARSHQSMLFLRPPGAQQEKARLGAQQQEQQPVIAARLGTMGWLRRLWLFCRGLEEVRQHKEEIKGRSRFVYKRLFTVEAKRSHDLGVYAYCFFFFVLHVICFHFLIGLDFLNSIYGAFCVLLISSIFLSSFFWLRSDAVLSAASERSQNRSCGRDSGMFNCISSLPNRHIVLAIDASHLRNHAARHAQNSALACFAPVHASHQVSTASRSHINGLRVLRACGTAANPSGLQVAEELVQSMANRHSGAEGAQLSAMKIAHTGIVFFISGILLSNTFKFQFTEQLHSGALARLGSQICCLRSIDHSFAPTFHSICANLIVYQQPNFDFLYRIRGFAPLSHNAGRLATSQGAKHSEQMKLTHSGINAGAKGSVLHQSEEAQSSYAEAAVCLFPEKRFYFSNQELTTTKVAIHSNLFTDIYGLIGTGSFETGWFTTIMRLPFIFCIWLGFLFGVIGGYLALKKQLQKPKINWI